LHVIVTQQRATAEQWLAFFITFESADEGADMSELQAHHCITLEQWSWGVSALQQAFWGNMLGIAFICLQRFGLDLSFSSNCHSSDSHQRIMSQFISTRKL